MIWLSVCVDMACVLLLQEITERPHHSVGWRGTFEHVHEKDKAVVILRCSKYWDVQDVTRLVTVDGVLDCQLDLLDYSVQLQLQRITMYTLYNTSVQLDTRLATVPQPVFQYVRN
jgi:hypothetical protein